MELGIVIKLSFVLGLVATMVALVPNILNENISESLLIAGLITSILYIGLAIHEVKTSKTIDKSEKTCGLLLSFLWVGSQELFILFLTATVLPQNLYTDT